MRKANLLKQLPIIISVSLMQIPSNALAVDDKKVFLGSVNLEKNPELFSAVNPEHSKMVTAIMNNQQGPEEKANKQDWNKTPEELINEPVYQEAFKKAKKDVCLKEETTNSFINWTTNGCDNVLAITIKKEEEKKELEDADAWTKKYAGESLKSIGKAAGSEVLNRLLSFQTDSSRYYGKGVESVRLPFFLGNEPNPYKHPNECTALFKEAYTAENKLIGEYQSLQEYKNDLANADEGSDAYEEAKSDIDNSQAKIDDYVTELKTLKEDASDTCMVKPSYKTESWMAIGYTDGSLMAYKTDANPESPYYHQPLVNDPEKCDLTDESTKDACKIPKDNIRYSPASEMLDKVSGDKENYSITSLRTMSAQNVKAQTIYNKVNLLVGYGRDQVVSYKGDSGINLADPTKSTYGLKKETNTDGGAIISATISSESGDDIEPRVVGSVEENYGVTDMQVIYEKKDNESANRFVVVQKEAESRSTDNFDFSIHIQTIGGFPIPLPSSGIVPLVGSLFGQPTVEKHIKFQTRKDNDSDLHDMKIPDKLRDKSPTITRSDEDMGVYFGYDKSQAYYLKPGDFIKDIEAQPILGSQKRGEIYASNEFSGSGCNAESGCGEAINYIYTIPDQDLVIYGSDKELMYVRYSNNIDQYQSGSKTKQGYGGYYLDNHSEFKLDGKVGHPINMFAWEHRLFLVLDTGKIVSFSYNANAPLGDQLAFDDNFEINNPLNVNTQKLREKLKSSTETLVSKDGKMAAFISSSPEYGINLFSTEGYGLKGEINSLSLSTTSSSSTSTDRLSSRGIAYQYNYSSHNPWRYKVNHPITNLNFKYNDEQNIDLPTELRFTFGEVDSKTYSTQLHFDGSVYSMKIENNKFKDSVYPSILQHDDICKHPDEKKDRVAEIYCNLNDSGPKFLQNI